MRNGTILALVALALTGCSTIQRNPPTDHPYLGGLRLQPNPPYVPVRFRHDADARRFLDTSATDAS